LFGHVEVPSVIHLREFETAAKGTGASPVLPIPLLAADARPNLSKNPRHVELPVCVQNFLHLLSCTGFSLPSSTSLTSR
jgi:hypothetical protein